MGAIALVFAGLLAAALLWPELPFSRAIARGGIALIEWFLHRMSMTRAILAISITLALFGAIWALQGDAPMFLAMALPEIAAWFATFEIATLAEAAIGLGSAYVALRVSGLGIASKVRIRARRNRKTGTAARKLANDDEPGGLARAA